MKNIKFKDLPDLPPLNFEDTKFLQRICSSGKAMGADGFSDQWIRSTDRIDLLCNLWNNEVLKLLRKSFKVELIPLNKVWPQIPLQD